MKPLPVILGNFVVTTVSLILASFAAASDLPLALKIVVGIALAVVVVDAWLFATEDDYRGDLFD